MKRFLWGIALVVLMAGSAHAALHSRLSGQAYYDDVLKITWLTNANVGAGSSYDDGANTTDGQMTWNSAQAWIGSLNATSHLGITNWRLPTVTDTGTSGCNFAYTGTDCGFNVDLSTGEMAHMFYGTLGNSGQYNTSGSLTGCIGISPSCVVNSGPFSLPDGIYWAGTTYAPDTSQAWFFSVDTGRQGFDSKINPRYAWAVSSGDQLNTPLPGAVWLLGSALGVMGALRRRAAKSSG